MVSSKLKKTPFISWQKCVRLLKYGVSMLIHVFLVLAQLAHPQSYI